MCATRFLPDGNGEHGCQRDTVVPRLDRRLAAEAVGAAAFAAARARCREGLLRLLLLQGQAGLLLKLLERLMKHLRLLRNLLLRRGRGRLLQNTRAMGTQHHRPLRL